MMLNKQEKLKSAEQLWREYFGEIEAKEMKNGTFYKKEKQQICAFCGEPVGPACCE